MKRLAVSLLFACAAASAQTSGLLPAREALDLFRRTVELMDANTVAVPGLARAAAPVIENARQTLGTLAATQGNTGLTYAFLTHAKAFLALSDAMPKPFPFPDEARRQYVQLRDTVDRAEAHFRALLDQKESQLRSPDRDNLRRYREANDRLVPPREQTRVVFLGDSITDGWRLNEYFPNRDFVNRGISGQITGEMLGRMKADVIDRRPAAMLVLAGTNDIGRGVPLETIQNNLAMIADLAEFHKIKPLFASVLPVSDYHKGNNPQYERSGLRPPATILALNQWLKDFCARRRFAYVDYFSATVDKDGYLRAEMADDGLHPNAAGYRVMAPLALAAINAVSRPPAAAPVDPKRKR